MLVTDPLLGKMEEEAKKRFPHAMEKLVFIFAETGDEEELQQKAPGMDIMMGARYKISARVIDKADELFFIQQCSQGYENVDLEACRKRGIKVSNAGTAGEIPVAEHALMLMLAVSKSLIRSHETMREGEWIFNELVSQIYELRDKLVGLIGLGKIGTQTARLANCFDARLQYYDPYRKSTEDLNFPIQSVELDKLLQTSDIVSIHCLFTDQTHHLIGRKELEMMKPTAILINTARGAIVDEEALADILAEGKIRGAGLDVYGTHHEAPPSKSRLLGLPNVILTPHVGGATAEDIQRNFYITSLGNVVDVVNGKEPKYQVIEYRI